MRLLEEFSEISLDTKPYIKGSERAILLREGLTGVANSKPSGDSPVRNTCFIAGAQTIGSGGACG